MASIGLRYLLATTVLVGCTSSQAWAAADCPEKNPDGGFSFFIRNDFTDLGPFSCTHNVVSSQGATISWTNNLLTNQNTASLDGLIGVEYTKYFGAQGGLLQGYSLGGYIQGDDTYQFQPTSTQAWNGYTVTPGAFAEIDLANRLPFLSGGTDAFRLRGGQVNGSTGTTFESIVGEWIPVYAIGSWELGKKNPLGTTGLLYTFAPEVMVQYDQFDTGPKTASLFSMHNEALRVGPEVLLILNFNEKFLPNFEWLKNASVQITNHESWDQYSGKEYAWTAFALNYTFDNAPNFGLPPDAAPRPGLSLSYGFGNSETTGNLTKQVKLGLALKL